MRSVKRTTKYTNSRLFWNKKGTKVGAKSREGEPLAFKSYPTWLNANFPKITYNITYEYPSMELKKLNPSEGFHEVRFNGFSHKKDEKPSPKEMTIKGDGWTQDILAFWANCQLTNPKFNGLEISFRLDYSHVEQDIEGDAVVDETYKPGRFLLDFLNAIQVPDMKYKDNLLPKWEKKANKKATFKVRYKGGWVQEIIIDEFDEEDDDDDFFEDAEELEDELAGFDED